MCKICETQSDMPVRLGDEIKFNLGILGESIAYLDFNNNEVNNDIDGTDRFTLCVNSLVVDKHGRLGDDCKAIKIDIKYCPFCGRELK